MLFLSYTSNYPLEHLGENTYLLIAEVTRKMLLYTFLINWPRLSQCRQPLISGYSKSPSPVGFTSLPEKQTLGLQPINQASKPASTEHDGAGKFMHAQSAIGSLVKRQQDIIPAQR